MGYQIRMRDEELTDGAPTPAKSFEQAATQPVYDKPVTLSDRQPISGRFREGSVGTAPVGSVDYTTTAGERGRPAGSLTQELDASSAALRDQFARNPVTPRGPVAPFTTATSRDAPPAPSGTLAPGVGFFADRMREASLMANGGNKAGALGAGMAAVPTSLVVGAAEAAKGMYDSVGKPLANAAGRFFTGATGVEVPGVQVTADATTVRPPTSRPGTTAPPGTTAGPFSDARYEAQRAPAAQVAEPGQSVPVPVKPGPISVAREGMTTEEANAVYGRQLAVMKAQEGAALAHRDREALRTTDAMQARYEAEIARGNAARGMKAAQESITNRNKYGGYIKDRTSEIEAIKMMPLPPQYAGEAQPGVVQNAIAAQDFNLRNERAPLDAKKAKMGLLKDEQDLANGANTAAIEKMKLEQATRVNDIHSKLMDPKLDPKEHDRLSRTLLTMLGKDKPEEFKVHPISLPDSVDPATGAVLKGGQAAAIIDNRTGKYEIVRLNETAGAEKPAAKAEPKVGEVHIDKNGNRAKYLGGGKWGPA